MQQPKSSRPNEGILNVNLELSQLGAPNFEAARQTDTSIQLNRLLEKCLKDSKAVDLESLCIKLNEKVCNVYIYTHIHRQLMRCIFIFKRYGHLELMSMC